MAKRVFLDTETTGLGRNDQVVQVAVVDEKGQVLFSSFVSHEKTPMNPVAAKVHGIGPHILASAPRWPEVWERLRPVLEQATTIVAFNAVFDLRALQQTAALYGHLLSPQIASKFKCAMKPVRDCLGQPPHARWPNQDWSQQKAIAHLGINISDCRAHDAVGDAIALSRLMQAIEAQPPQKATDANR